MAGSACLEHVYNHAVEIKKYVCKLTLFLYTLKFHVKWKGTVKQEVILTYLLEPV